MGSQASTLALPSYALGLVHEALHRTGYPLVLTEEDGIGYDSQLRMAGRTQPFHELAYVPAYRPFRLHFLISAAFKIRRVWEVPPDERLLPISDAGRGLPAEDEAELRRKLRGMPTSAIDDLSRFLYHGLTQQLTSMPVDVRVEREIAESLPEHREAQHSYLSRQVRDLEPHFRPEIAEFSPERLYAACTAMNIVLAEEAAEIADVEPGPMFRQNPHRGLGERLRKHLHAVDEPGYRGDRVLTDTWADELGLRDWYEWKRLDKVR